jgi:acetyltransferase-like isoleucine patch superfamily enzyme
MASRSESTPPVVEQALAVAGMHVAEGRADEAVLLYEQVLGHEPGNVDALYGLAVLHHERREDAEARCLLDAAQAVRPGDTRVEAVLAELEPVPAATDAPPRVSAPSPSFSRRAFRRFAVPGLSAVSQRPRIWKYRALSTCLRVSGTPIELQPVLFVGSGEVILGDGVQFGWKTSPLFYTGYCHVEVTGPAARIELGDRSEFNNNTLLKSEGAGIRVGADGLFGPHVEVFDSNFHDLHPDRRHGGTPTMAPVDVGRNVFVGMSVKILKGVTVGDDAVIGAGAVVSSSVPAGVIVAGNPARIVGELS